MVNGKPTTWRDCLHRRVDCRLTRLQRAVGKDVVARNRCKVRKERFQDGSVVADAVVALVWQGGASASWRGSGTLKRPLSQR